MQVDDEPDSEGPDLDSLSGTIDPAGRDDDGAG